MATLTAFGIGPVVGLGFLVLGAGLVGWVASAAPVLQGMRALSARAIRLGTTFGIILPLVFAAGVSFGTFATQARFDAAMAQFDQFADRATLLSDQASVLEAAPGGQGGISGFFTGASQSMGQTVEATQRYWESARFFVTNANDLFLAVVQIVAIFVLRMIVFPGILFWGVFRMAMRPAS